MSAFYPFNQHNPSNSLGGSSHQPSHNHHHGGRSRRAPRLSNAQNSHRQFRGVRSMKELTEAPQINAYRQRFEMHRGFDLDDDLEFIPGLLTEDDLSSINSSGSDRSSLSSGSPTNSPLQHQAQPTQASPPFSLTNAYNNFQPQNLLPPVQVQTKVHQPQAVRQRNAIPIVNPTTGMRLPSPPLSVSPGRLNGQGYNVRRW